MIADPLIHLHRATVVAIALAMPFSIGCGEQVTTKRYVPTSVETSGDSGLEISLAKQSNLNNETSGETDADPPASSQVSIPDDMNFFSMPESNVPRKQSVTSETDDAEVAVRLVGFLNEDPSTPGLRKAILKIGDMTTQLSVGDTHGDTSLVSIDGRSVTIQQFQRRWKIHLFGQEIANRPSGPVVTRYGNNNRFRPRSTIRDDIPVQATETAALEIPAAIESLPSTPALPTPSLDSMGSPFDLSDELQLPEIPDLPGLPGM